MDQAADYSGKKRATRKNTLIIAQDRYTHYLEPTTSATTHDYRILQDEFDANLGLLCSLPH